MMICMDFVINVISIGVLKGVVIVPKQNKSTNYWKPFFMFGFAWMLMLTLTLHNGMEIFAFWVMLFMAGCLYVET